MSADQAAIGPDVLIPLRDRFGNVAGHTVVDAADKNLAKHRWYLLGGGYAVRVTRIDGRRRMTYLHRTLLGLQHGDLRVGDHRDGDRLNNRRSNLRTTTPSGNAQNRGANAARLLPRNVYTRGDRWRVQVKVGGKPKHLGVFLTIEAADEVARLWRAQHMPLSPDAARAALASHHGVSL